MKLDHPEAEPQNQNSATYDDRNDRVINRRMVIATSAAALMANGVSAPAAATSANPELDSIIQPVAADEEAFMKRAFELRQRAVDFGDQAYGAIVVREGKIIGQSWSRVVIDIDPTGHAEMAAIRDAARRTGTRDLDGSILYSSSRACPMCEAAAYWAGIDQLVHGRAMTKAGPPMLCR